MSHSDYSIAVLISGNGSNLQAIIDATQSGRINGRVSAVISNRSDAFGLDRARQAGIANTILTSDEAIASYLADLSPQLIVLAGYMRILGAAFTRQFAGRLINIHPSLLPAYRGLDTHTRALAAGDTEHGCSVHFVTPELDAGPIIAQSIVPIAPEDTPESLQQKVQAAEHQLYPQVVAWLAAGRVKMLEEQVWFDQAPLRAPLQVPA
ncbi:MAG: phosphoribosylglycinamide formyltransferase [Gammaproteobacteria bacterium]|nr:phosphoribosylglycinamide formyltransferase [Gammaproteobacteria bacterium]